MPRRNRYLVARRIRRRVRKPRLGSIVGYTPLYTRATRTLMTSRGSTTLLPNMNSSNPFSPRMFCRHKYGAVHSLSTGIAGSDLFGTEQVYSLNSLYDPDYTGIGHQPYGRDTLATVYNKYRVNAVKLDIVFYNSSIDALACAVQLVPPNQMSAIAGQNVGAMLESPNTQVKYLNTTGAQKMRFSIYVPLWKLSQISRQQFKSDDTQYSALTNNNPLLPMYVRMAVADSASNVAGNCQVSIQLTYYTVWSNRQQLLQS